MGGGIDPRIALQGQQPQIQGPIDLAQGALSVQHLINAVQLQKQQQAAMQVQQQQQQIALQEQQQFAKDQQQFNKDFHDAGGDWATAIKNATDNGVSAQFIIKAEQARTDELAKRATYSKTQLENENTKMDLLAKHAYALSQIDDPQERSAQYTQWRNDQLIKGTYKPNELPASVPDDNGLKSIMAQSKTVMDMNKEAAELAAKNAELPGQKAEAMQKRITTASQLFNGVGNQIAWTARRNYLAKSDPELAAQIPENFSPEAVEQVKQMGISPEKVASMPLEKQSYQQWAAAQPPGADKSIQAFQLQADVAKQKALMPGEIQKVQAEAGARGAAEIAMLDKLAKQSQQGGKTVAPGMTQDTTDQAATTYHNTGTLPAVGRGQAGVAQRTAIMNREREMFPGTTMTVDSAEFKSNAASLKKVQGQADFVGAFENTALKNLDQAVAAMKNVPDVGVRFGNVPVRMLTGDMIGTDNMARLRTALYTAQAESARVLNSANASGVLTNEARGEAKKLLDGDLPVSAFLAQADQLKIDMGNRKQSYADQIADITRRMQGAGKSGGSSTAVPSNVQKVLANASPGVHKLSDGSTWTKDKDGTIHQ